MTAAPINIFEYEALAKERLPQAEYGLLHGGNHGSRCAPASKVLLQITALHHGSRLTARAA